MGIVVRECAICQRGAAVVVTYAAAKLACIIFKCAINQRGAAPIVVHPSAPASAITIGNREPFDNSI